VKSNLLRPLYLDFVDDQLYQFVLSRSQDEGRKSSLVRPLGRRA
jgi:hypothetical protein